MPILNMIAQGGGGGNIGEPLNLAVTASGLDATITWEDNEIGTIPPTSFQKSELVRKIGSAPTSPSDGDLVVTETVKDTYKTTGYVDQGLTDGETYYYRVFSYSDLGGISYCDAVSVTIDAGWQPGANTIAYYPLINNANDESGNGNNATNYGGTFSSDGCYLGTATSRLELPSVSIGQIATINFWVKFPNGISGSKELKFYADWSSSYRNMIYGCGASVIYSSTGNNGTSQDNFSVSTSMGTGWVNIVLVKNGTSLEIYKDGTSIGTHTSTYNPSLPGGINATYIGHSASDTNAYSAYGYVKDYIIEDKARSAQEVSDYFDLTKGDYGIS